MLAVSLRLVFQYQVHKTIRLKYFVYNVKSEQYRFYTNRLSWSNIKMKKYLNINTTSKPSLITRLYPTLTFKSGLTYKEVVLMRKSPWTDLRFRVFTGFCSAKASQHRNSFSPKTPLFDPIEFKKNICSLLKCISIVLLEGFKRTLGTFKRKG